MRKMLLFLLLFAIASYATDGLSVQMALPAPLQTNILPYFSGVRGSDWNSIFKLTDLQKLIHPSTKRVAFVFFATWCPPCREGTIRLHKSNPESRGLQVIMVNVYEQDYSDPEKVFNDANQWVKEYGDENWQLIFDNQKNMINKFGLSAIGDALPFTLLLDNNLKPLSLIGQEGNDWPQILWR